MADFFVACVKNPLTLPASRARGFFTSRLELYSFLKPLEEAEKVKKM
jgi:hypothetical protein